VITALGALNATTGAPPPTGTTRTSGPSPTHKRPFEASRATGPTPPGVKVASVLTAPPGAMRRTLPLARSVKYRLSSGPAARPQGVESAAWALSATASPPSAPPPA